MPADRKLGIIRLDRAQLADLLQLPDGWSVVSVSQDWYTTSTELMVEGPDLRNVAAGVQPPQLHGYLTAEDLTVQVAQERKTFRRFDWKAYL